MSDPTAHRRLRVSLIAGSLYDMGFATINLVAPEMGSVLLGIPLPHDQIYLRFTGIFLFMLALFYLLPAMHPGRYLGNVVVAIIGRTAGAIFLAVAVLSYGRPGVFLALAAGDLVFGLVHAWFLYRAEGGNPLRHFLF